MSKNGHNALEEENRALKNKIEQLENRRTLPRRFMFKVARNILLGKDLADSTNALINELSEGKLRSDSIANVLKHVLWRITRIGFFAIVAAILPVTILIIQTILLSNQNKKLEYQNERIVQQTYLQEAERRSSLIFLFNNVLDDINQELSESPNRMISDDLIGRIATLSHALKPYRYLSGDAITATQLSPERGQLLLYLINSNFEVEVYDKIFRTSNFRYTELNGVKFDSIYLKGIDLSYGDISGVEITNSDMSFSNLDFTNLANTNFNASSLMLTTFNGASIKYGSWPDVDLTFASFRNCSVDSTDFSGSSFSGAIIDECVLNDVSINNSEIGRKVLSTISSPNSFSFYELDYALMSRIINNDVSFYKFASPDEIGDLSRKELFDTYNNSRALEYFYRLPTIIENSTIRNSEFICSVFDSTIFRSVLLENNDFDGSSFVKTDFDKNEIKDNFFTNTIFISSNISEEDLNRNDFKSCIYDYTTMSGWSRADNLLNLNELLQSEVYIDTIYSTDSLGNLISDEYSDIKVGVVNWGEKRIVDFYLNSTITNFSSDRDIILNIESYQDTFTLRKFVQQISSDDIAFWNSLLDSKLVSMQDAISEDSLLFFIEK